MKIESQRSVEKRYNKLLLDVATNDCYEIDLKNRVNCYSCECGHVTKTRDVDAGVTPFFHNCAKCGGEAKSSFYKDIKPEAEPTQEWFRPTLKEVQKMRSKPGLIDHILQGGLINRKIKNNL